MRTNIQLGNIHVNTIQSTSGIFISQTNFANGWKSQSKSNSGFGDIAGDNSKLENCIFIVSDDDVIDSSTEDNSVLIEKNVNPANNDTMIQFNGIEVELQSTNSTISIGDSIQTGWTSKNKSNEGNGLFSGENTIAHNKILINDRDIVDAPINDRPINTNL